MASAIPIPTPVLRFFEKFPLYTFPEVSLPHAKRNADSKDRPTLWIAPPKPDLVLPSTNLLSQDVECLKWQAYIALRGIKDVGLRWDMSPDGAVDGRLPSLQTSDREVLGARMIPGWADDVLQNEDDAFEGYKDAAAKDESRAWVSLLEGVVHVALSLSKPPSYNLKALLLYAPKSKATFTSLSTHLSPPAAPLTGITSLLHPYGERVSLPAIQAQYHNAIISLSDRLGHDEWFLGSSGPTALDALAFAYVHCLLDGPDNVRFDVTRRINLVSWHRRVKAIVQTAFLAV